LLLPYSCRMPWANGFRRKRGSATGTTSDRAVSVSAERLRNFASTILEMEELVKGDRRREYGAGSDESTGCDGPGRAAWLPFSDFGLRIWDFPLLGLHRPSLGKRLRICWSLFFISNAELVE
jgi:hypothetical protein